MVTIETPYPPIGEADLRFIESEIGTSLPDQYRNFLLKNNGGHPTPQKFATRNGKIESMVVDFFPVMKNSEESLLGEVDGITKAGQIPSNLIPIAIDPSEDRIVISVSGPDRGKIYYWCWGAEPDPVSCSYEYISLIADDFDSFLAILRD